MARNGCCRRRRPLGAAGGDGTQALVAGVATEHGIPFVVIPAGTRNHFALDLGLDRDDPAACLDALSDGVDLRVDLGVIGGQTFVNNVSFGAYAEIVETPAYRDDKLHTTLNLLPDLLQGQRGSPFTARVGQHGNPGPAGAAGRQQPVRDRRCRRPGPPPRLDRGVLGVVGVKVGSARQAVGLLRGEHADGLSVLDAERVEITADTEQIPVGINGEAVLVPTPVECAIRRALRVRVPRNRPGVPRPKSPLNWARLRHLAAPRRPGKHAGAIQPAGPRAHPP